MEYVDSTDELAYITSLEQQNAELIYALNTLMHDISCRGHHISDYAVWAARKAISNTKGNLNE